MNSFCLITRFVLDIFPSVKRLLADWEAKAASGERALSSQALASIRQKRFHCLGGSIYSLYPGTQPEPMLRLIVALQTISDYLDNLCDRAGITDELAFRQLHLAVSDALTPGKEPADYYQYYPYKDDNDYLSSLVRACQQEVARLPFYPLVMPYVLLLAARYSELQTYKHLDISVREKRMLEWAQDYMPEYSLIGPWEFAAASGSTLGIFLLCALAARDELTEREALQAYQVYFPWICGLHILLDYFIDRSEDQAGGDLNFVSYYSDDEQTFDRLSVFWHQSLTQAASLPQSSFHITVVKGLFAMYLSDPKSQGPREKFIRNRLLQAAGLSTRLMYEVCKLLRRKGLL